MQRNIFFFNKNSQLFLLPSTYSVCIFWNPSPLSPPPHTHTHDQVDQLGKEGYDIVVLVHRDSSKLQDSSSSTRSRHTYRKFSTPGLAKDFVESPLLFNSWKEFCSTKNSTTSSANQDTQTSNSNSRQAKQKKTQQARKTNSQQRQNVSRSHDNSEVSHDSSEVSHVINRSQSNGTVSTSSMNSQTQGSFVPVSYSSHSTTVQNTPSHLLNATVHSTPSQLTPSHPTPSQVTHPQPIPSQLTPSHSTSSYFPPFNPSSYPHYNNIMYGPQPSLSLQWTHTNYPPTFVQPPQSNQFNGSHFNVSSPRPHPFPPSHSSQTLPTHSSLTPPTHSSITPTSQQSGSNYPT